MQKESENLQQKNLSFGEQVNFQAFQSERKSAQQINNQYDYGINQNQYRHSNQTNKNKEQVLDNDLNQNNYNFAALRSTNQSNPNHVDLKKIQEFMDLNHTGGQKSLGGNGSGSRRSNTSFADEVQKEIQDFNAGKYNNQRNRTGSNQSRNSNSDNHKIRQSAGVKANNMEYQKNDKIGSEVKVAGRRSDDRFSDKLSFFLKNVKDDENSVSSLSKRLKDNHQDSFMGAQNAQYYPPFIDDKLSNINDTMMSNAKLGQPASNQLPKNNIQVINAIANVFDNIDLLNPNKESVIQQLNDSQINSKFLIADNNEEIENQKELSPQRESFKVTKQENGYQKDKHGQQLNDETGSFAKDGFGNYGERNSILDNHQAIENYHHHSLINQQAPQYQQNDSSKNVADPYENAEFQNFQRQTFNPNDQNLINPLFETKQEDPRQLYDQREIKKNENNKFQERDEFKAEVIQQPKKGISREEREKQIEMMMDQLMATRQNFIKKQQNDQQQTQNIQNNYVNKEALQKSDQNIIQPAPIQQQDPNQFQNVRHDPFQDQFKVWQSQKNQSQKKSQNEQEVQNKRSSSKVSDQISNQLNQNWETLASQIQIPINKEPKQNNPKIQEYVQQAPIENNSKKEIQIENNVQIEIKAIKIESRNEKSVGKKHIEEVNSYISSPRAKFQPLNQFSNIGQQVPPNQSQYLDSQQSFYSQNPSNVQQLFSPMKNTQDHNLNQSEFGATRGRNDQFRQQSRSGSRMSQAGRNQKYADGRQSRSGSKSSLANQEDQSSYIQNFQNKPQINQNSLHIQKNPNIMQYSNQDSQTQINNYNYNSKPVAGSNRQQMIEINNMQMNANAYQPITQKPQSNMTSFRSQASDWSLDQTMELKKKQMAEDQAKALQAQQQLENLAKKRRQEEQQKLLNDLKNSKLFQQSQKTVPEQHLRDTKASPLRLLKQEPRKISITRYHDDEFNDIDESTDKVEANTAIRVSGPQNHRRYDEYQGPLHQRNQQFEAAKNKNQFQKPAHQQSIRSMKQINQNIQQTESKFEHQSQHPFGTIISSSQQQTNDQNSINLINNIDPSYQNYSDNRTQPINGYSQVNQYSSAVYKNTDPIKTKSVYVEKENQVKRDNYQEFNPQNQRNFDSKVENSERRNSASRFFQALSQKRSESRGNGRRNSRSGALQEVINRSNSRGDRFRFFGKKEGDSDIQNNQDNQNTEPNTFSIPTQKQLQKQSNQQFQYEFQTVIQKNLQKNQNRNPSFNIAEVLKDLGFIFQMNQSSIQDNRLKIMLDQQRENLNLIQNGGSGQQKYFNENIDNMFKILCCIIGLELDNRNSIKLEQSILDSMLSRIDIHKEDQDILILEQLVMIKFIVGRPMFSLNDNQAAQIQSKFINLASNRNNCFKQAENIVKKEAQNQRVLSPRIHSGVRQQEQINISLHSTAQQINQRPWQGNRPLSRAGSGARQNSNTQMQVNYKPVQTFPETRFQDESQNLDIKSNSSITHQQQDYRQFNDAINQKNNQQRNFQSRSPYRQQYNANPNLQNQNIQNVQQNMQVSNAKLNQVRPANSSQFCPSEPETIRDSFNPTESDSYIGARETQRFNEFQKVATPTPLLTNNSNQTLKNINQQSYQNRSPFRDNGYKKEQPHQQQNNQKIQMNVGLTQNKNQISDQTNSNTDNGQSNINMLNDSFGPIHHTKTESQGQNVQIQKLQGNQMKQKQPICVLKIELDGSHVEEIQVYDGEDPKFVVQRFAQMFNLSDEAIQKLTLQVQQQIQIYNKNKSFKI